jgi:hypothetical protein
MVAQISCNLPFYSLGGPPSNAPMQWLRKSGGAYGRGKNREGITRLSMSMGRFEQVDFQGAIPCGLGGLDGSINGFVALELLLLSVFLLPPLIGSVLHGVRVVIREGFRCLIQQPLRARPCGHSPSFLL